MEPLTQTEYSGLQRAYDFFNTELFGGTLPQLLITLQRHPRARGYFSPLRFHGRIEQDAITHEIALNPDTFQGRTDEEVLSTLVHEMVHAWQQEQGTPPRRCYHNKEWSAKMKEVGLQPSDTGEPGGKEIGQRVTHYIIQGGRFQTSLARLTSDGVRLNWESPAPTQSEATAKAKKRASKTKYSCPSCEQNAWAKPDSNIMCGDCKNLMEPA